MLQVCLLKHDSAYAGMWPSTAFNCIQSYTALLCQTTCHLSSVCHVHWLRKIPVCGKQYIDTCTKKTISITVLLQTQVSWLYFVCRNPTVFQTLCAIFLVVYSEDHNMLRLQPKLKRHMGMLSLSCDCSLTSGVQANCSAASQGVHPSAAAPAPAPPAPLQEPAGCP